LVGTMTCPARGDTLVWPLFSSFFHAKGCGMVLSV
jgi:hypothetical protein